MASHWQDYIWTTVRDARAASSSHWIQIDYRQSLAAPLLRPVIRFTRKDGPEYAFGQAPLFGQGRWVGFVPRGTTAIDMAHGPESAFAYDILSTRRLWLASLLPRAFRHNRSVAFEALGAAFIRAEREHAQALGFARGGMALRDYDAWRKALQRPVELSGLDGALIRACEGAPGVAILAPEHVTAPQQEVLLARLEAQAGVRWTVFFPSSPSTVRIDDQRILRFEGDAPLKSVISQLAPSDLLIRISPDLELAPLALAQAANAAKETCEGRLFYGDEDSRASSGHYHSPLLKPGWSPLLENHLPYLGQAVFWRARHLVQTDASITAFDTPAFRRALLATAGPAQVRPIHRILATRLRDPEASAPDRTMVPTPPAGAAHVHEVASSPEVSIIIANKNRLSLLEPCIESILEASTFRNFEIILVDNGSSDADVLAYYRALETRGAAKVLYSPGPFNFSLLSNRGATEARGHWLVFLNNDMEIVAPDWLEQLRQHALNPQIGAVGARLLFPDGTLQHGGVIVGQGGFADHIHHSAPGHAAGYLGRLSVPHELSAVTGACIAVEAHKFNAVGGFDAVNLPVELNDIDLCLKLGAAGWQTVMEPRAVLIHHQSASRGRALLPFTRYGRERAYFRARWLEVIRDDPYFHPALSDFSVEPELAG